MVACGYNMGQAEGLLQFGSTGGNCKSVYLDLLFFQSQICLGS